MSTAKITVEAKPTERTEAEAARAAPVSLPAGSYDAEALAGALKPTTLAKGDKTRDTDREKIVAEQNEHKVTDGLQPGYRRVEVEDLNAGVTESRIVYDPEQADEAEASQAGKSQPAADAAKSE